MSIFIEAKDIPKNAKFIDTRFNLSNSEEGYALYTQLHIEGAVYWDLNKDLSDLSKQEGRHPMPSNEQLQALFERSGLHLDDEIVIYDQGGAPYSSRAWFLLHYAGFSNIRIVNGGLEALLQADYPLTNEMPAVTPSSLTLDWKDVLVATKEQVREVADGNKGAILLDARSYQRYIGEIEPIDPVAGHIPGAQSFDWEQLLKENRFVPNEDLRATYGKDQAYIVYCGSGVTAAPLFVTMFNEGYADVQLYVGGFSDWITTYPVATGDETK